MSWPSFCWQGLVFVGQRYTDSRALVPFGLLFLLGSMAWGLLGASRFKVSWVSGVGVAGGSGLWSFRSLGKPTLAKANVQASLDQGSKAQVSLQFSRLPLQRNVTMA